MRTARITANQGASLSLFAAGGNVTASTVTRTLAGPIVRYGVYGRTSAGRLKVAPGALRFPAELHRVKLTREHVREESRGHLVDVVDDGQQIRAALRVADGPEGDAALREAADRTRDGFSFDVIDAVIDGDTITSALVIAIGQVGIPAYDDMRIDTVAAAHTDPADPIGTTEETRMTAAQRARLAELRALQSRSAEQETELQTLVTLEAANPAPAPAAAPEPAAAATAPAPAAEPAAVAASLPAVPAGVPSGQTAPARTNESALDHFVNTLVDGFRPGGGGVAAVTAALTDITHGAHADNILTPAWSGELWSGLQYVPEWTPLFNSADLTAVKGKGWRFTQKPEIQDYAGNKAAIPSGPITTEDSDYAAARMAVGHDIDRAFWDFPDAGFLRGYLEAVRESWAIKLDNKVRAYVLANAVEVTGPDGADVGTDPDPVVEPTVFQAVARIMLALKRRRVGRGTFVVMNDEDWFSLFGVTEQNKPAFLELFNVTPSAFLYDELVPQGTIIGGVRQSATVRTLPGSPIRVDAQNIANGGVDSGFFGYWAIEQHHTEGIASVEFDPS